MCGFKNTEAHFVELSLRIPGKGVLYYTGDVEELWRYPVEKKLWIFNFLEVVNELCPAVVRTRIYGSEKMST